MNLLFHYGFETLMFWSVMGTESVSLNVQSLKASKLKMKIF